MGRVKNEAKMDVKEFDQIAREIFAPIYPVIAGQIKQRTGITSGICLDIGCGGGYLGLALARLTDLRIYLLDKLPEMLMIAAGNIAAAGLADRMHTLLADVREIPLPDQSVNLIISRGSVFFWEDLLKPFSEIYRALEPGGMAYIGGGFGTAKLKQEITARMEQKDPDWRAMMDKNIGQNAPETFQEALQQAKIPDYEINRDEAGLWLVIKK